MYVCVCISVVLVQGLNFGLSNCEQSWIFPKLVLVIVN